MTRLIRMRIIAAPALAAWIVTSSAISVLGNDLSGTIKSIDIQARQVVLDDGNAYSVRRGINLAKFAVGERVTLHTEDENGKNMVTKLTKGEYVPPGFKQSSRRRGFL